MITFRESRNTANNIDRSLVLAFALVLSIFLIVSYTGLCLLNPARKKKGYDMKVAWKIS